MFRRRTSSSGKIHYRINIDKSMCPNPVDIYIDGDTYQHSFNGSSLDIYRNKKIEVIRIGGQISQKDQQYEYNVFVHCDLADTELYGDRTTEFTPITEITDPEEIINFTYMPKLYNHITNKARITWQGDLITSGYCITANACEGCQSIAVGTSIYNNTYSVNIIIVAPS